MQASITALVVVADQALRTEVLSWLDQHSVISQAVVLKHDAASTALEHAAELVVTDMNAADLTKLRTELWQAGLANMALLVVGPVTAQADSLRAGADEFLALPLDSATFERGLQYALQCGKARADALQQAYDRGVAAERTELMAQVQSDSLALMSRLAANIAHEINNPLTPIIGLAEMLIDEANPHSTASFASRAINDSARRIAAVVRSLMSFTRPLSYLEEVDIRDLLAETMLGIQQELHDQRVLVRIYQPDKPIIYKASIAEMRQALFLMIEHARLLMPNGGILEITLEQIIANDQPVSLIIAVRDSGSPIAAYHVRHIFQPFYAATGPGIGLGPGLAIARRIIEQHGGAIALEPGIDRGNTLRAVLPIR